MRRWKNTSKLSSQLLPSFIFVEYLLRLIELHEGGSNCFSGISYPPENEGSRRCPPSVLLPLPSVQSEIHHARGTKSRASRPSWTKCLLDWMQQSACTQRAAAVRVIINSKCCNPPPAAAAAPKLKPVASAQSVRPLISPKQVSVRYRLSLTPSPPLHPPPSAPRLPLSPHPRLTSACLSANPLVTEKRSGEGRWRKSEAGREAEEDEGGGERVGKWRPRLRSAPAAGRQSLRPSLRPSDQLQLLSVPPGSRPRLRHERVEMKSISC